MFSYVEAISKLTGVSVSSVVAVVTLYNEACGYDLKEALKGNLSPLTESLFSSIPTDAPVEPTAMAVTNAKVTLRIVNRNIK